MSPPPDRLKQSNVQYQSINTCADVTVVIVKSNLKRRRSILHLSASDGPLRTSKCLSARPTSDGIVEPCNKSEYEKACPTHFISSGLFCSGGTLYPFFVFFQGQVGTRCTMGTLLSRRPLDVLEKTWYSLASESHAIPSCRASRARSHRNSGDPLIRRTSIFRYGSSNGGTRLACCFRRLAS